MLGHITAIDDIFPFIQASRKPLVIDNFSLADHGLSWTPMVEQLDEQTEEIPGGSMSSGKY
jgi:hypothetical protein